MSRRMGPGGRLRPAPRPHRAAAPFQPGRPPGFLAPRSADAGIDDTPGGVSRPVDAGVRLAIPLDHDEGADTGAAKISQATAVPADDRTPIRAPMAPRNAEPRQASSGPRSPAPHQERSPGGGCTAPQLRRFIKSRAYVPMHELRRRFAIEGGDDDVTRIVLQSGCIYVGLPSQEGLMLGDLLRGGEIGFELSMDPLTPVVIGVYAMRPIPRS